MPDKVEQKRVTRQRRHKHFMKKFATTSSRPRLIVFRSNKHIYAQLMDDAAQKTITGASSLSKAIADEVDMHVTTGAGGISNSIRTGEIATETVIGPFD